MSVAAVLFMGVAGAIGFGVGYWIGRVHGYAEARRDLSGWL